MGRVAIEPEAAREIQRLPLPIRARMLRIVERLERWPNVSGAKPLRHGLAGRYRIRTGDFRVRFRIEGERVVIERVGHHHDAYED